MKQIYFALLFFAFFFSAAPLSAQTGEGIQIKPGVIEDKVNPGEVYNFTLTVKNVSGNERTFYVLARDIERIDEKGTPIFAEEGTVPTQLELSRWISLPHDTLTLAPQEEKTLPFTISIPVDAAPGSHFGGVFLETEPPKVRTTGAAVSFRVGSVISLKISGDVIEDVQLREFATEKVVYSTPSVEFAVKVDNKGNVLMRPHGLLEVANMFGTQVASIRVNEKGSPVFPGGDKTYTASWSTDTFSIGRYQAVVSMVYGDNSRTTVTAATSFWILPIKFISLTLLSVVGFIGFVYALTQMYIRRTLRRMGVNRRSDMGLYAKRYQRGSPRLLIVLISVVTATIVFLSLLFFMFA